MRMLLHVTMPHETFNAAVRDGSVGRKLNQILEEMKPQSGYFTEYGGKRTALLVVDLHGNVLGMHSGIIHYTVGQRRGLGVGTGEPL